jgi:hypothetical protein
LALRGGKESRQPSKLVPELRALGAQGLRNLFLISGFRARIVRCVGRNIDARLRNRRFGAALVNILASAFASGRAWY